MYSIPIVIVTILVIMYSYGHYLYKKNKKTDGTIDLKTLK